MDISLRLGLSPFYACIMKKVKIHAAIFNSPTFKQKLWEEWEPLVSTAGVQHPPGSLGHQGGTCELTHPHFTALCCWGVSKGILGGQSQQRAAASGVWENPEQEPSSVPFLCFLWSAAGTGALFYVGEQQEGLQDSLKILHNSDKFENCSASNNRIQVSFERQTQAGLNEQTGRQVLQKKAVS